MQHNEYDVTVIKVVDALIDHQPAERQQKNHNAKDFDNASCAIGKIKSQDIDTHVAVCAQRVGHTDHRG